MLFEEQRTIKTFKKHLGWKNSGWGKAVSYSITEFNDWKKIQAALRRLDNLARTLSYYSSSAAAVAVLGKQFIIAENGFYTRPKVGKGNRKLVTHTKHRKEQIRHINTIMNCFKFLAKQEAQAEDNLSVIASATDPKRLKSIIVMKVKLTQ
ncbi:MAG: hypothetical protein JKY13_03805 [Gammaproteobacteria bacterium]|nr:hypothetical protein [Gammaproteobacteria bacterium]